MLSTTFFADDPCPRAWGALDLRHFVQQATQAVKKGLKDTYGSWKGTLASTVLEAMAEALLARPDFLMIQDFARKYEHVVPLRVLSANRQHFRWKGVQPNPRMFWGPLHGILREQAVWCIWFQSTRVPHSLSDFLLGCSKAILIPRGIAD